MAGYFERRLVKLDCSASSTIACAVSSSFALGQHSLFATDPYSCLASSQLADHSLVLVQSIVVTWIG